jgi:hypothetical protein
MTITSGKQTRRPLGRSIVAVVVGILAGVIPTLITDVVLHATGVFPPLGERMSDGPLVLATAYRVLYGILGSYVIARLAPARPMLHALIGGLIGVVVSGIGAVVTWNHVPSLGPHWYPIALIITALPCAWVGGRLRLMQLRTRAAI